MKKEKSISVMCPLDWYNKKVLPYLKKRSENQIRRYTMKELFYNAVGEFIKKHPSNFKSKK